VIKKILQKAVVLFFCHALAFSPLLQAAQLSLPSGDLTPPDITQPKYIDKVDKGKSHKISVLVTDNVAVKQVMLFYRVIGTERYQRLRMQNKAKTNLYYAIIHANKIKKPGIEYYIQAVDRAGNSLLHGYAFSPLSVKTTGDNTLAANTQDTKPRTEDDDDSIFSNKWFWIGLGVLVAGAAAGGGGGGGGGGEPTDTGSTVVVSAPLP